MIFSLPYIKWLSKGKSNKTERKDEESPEDSTFVQKLIARITAMCKTMKLDSICCLSSDKLVKSVFAKVSQASGVALASLMSLDLNPMGDFRGKRILLCDITQKPNLLLAAKRLVNGGAARVDCLVIVKPCWDLTEHEAPKTCQSEPQQNLQDMFSVLNPLSLFISPFSHSEPTAKSVDQKTAQWPPKLEETVVRPDFRTDPL